MSNIALSVGGRTYTVNCAAGEEDHIADLGRMIDGKLSAMGAVGQNETRNLLFAALLLADEVYELKSTVLTTPGHESPYATPDSHAAPPPILNPDRLEAIANRLENLASHLER